MKNNIMTTHTSSATSPRARSSTQSRFTSRVARGLSAAGLAWGLTATAVLPGAVAAQTAPPAVTTVIQVPHAAEQYLPTSLVFGNYPVGAHVGNAYSITGTFARRRRPALTSPPINSTPPERPAPPAPPAPSPSPPSPPA